MSDLVLLSPQPIDLGMIALAKASEAGGIAVFLGCTRAETSSPGIALTALEYEAYDEMAVTQMLALAREARGRWPIERIVMVHRTGRVPVGEPSVLIAVSTPHRGEAFEACRWLIDSLKRDVPIWKKEIWADGGSAWVHPATN